MTGSGPGMGRRWPRVCREDIWAEQRRVALWIIVWEEKHSAAGGGERDKSGIGARGGRKDRNMLKGDSCTERQKRELRNGDWVEEWQQGTGQRSSGHRVGWVGGGGG